MNVSATGYGLAAIQRGSGKLDLAAHTVASESLPRNSAAEAGKNSDLAAPLVELKEAEVQAKAGIKVIAAEDRMIGSLLDERA